MRLIYVFAFTVLITVTIGTIIKDLKNQDQISLVSPLVAGIYTEQTNIPTENIETYRGWQVFVNNYFRYKIHHPSDVIVKNSRNGDITLQKSKAINISITQEQLSEHDALNTVIEADIDSKKSKLKNNFYLINNISPIALGSATALTFALEENGQKITYFYLPQEENNYLVISSKTADFSGQDFLTSEKIIYSIEMLP